MSEKDDIAGKVKYPDRHKQEILFDGMKRHRNITPTDIDGFIDYNGNCFVYIEGKCAGKELDFGQKKALEHIVESHCTGGSRSFAIVFEHETPIGESIVAKDQFVREYYYKHPTGNFQWVTMSERKVTLLKAIEGIENYCKKLNIEI